jgi:5-methylcytosine-specific restriction enzyme subunit McrC
MVYCHHDELSVDVLQNRLLRSTLRRVALLKELDKSVRVSVQRVYRKLDGVRTIRIDRRSLGSVQIHRNNRAYAFLLGICRLLHDSLSVDSATGQIRFAGVPEKHLAHLFEAFVRGFYRRELVGWEVSRPRLRWHEAEGVAAEGKMLPDMQTDIVLMGAGRRITMDAKYYEDAFQVHHDKESVRSGHLYQIISYLQNAALSRPHGPAWEGILLYPAVAAGFRLRYRLLGHSVTVASVDLARDWKDIRSELMGLVEVGGAGVAAGIGIARAASS